MSYIIGPLAEAKKMLKKMKTSANTLRDTDSDKKIGGHGSRHYNKQLLQQKMAVVEQKITPSTSEEEKGIGDAAVASGEASENGQKVGECHQQENDFQAANQLDLEEQEEETRKVNKKGKKTKDASVYSDIEEDESDNLSVSSLNNSNSEEISHANSSGDDSGWQTFFQELS